MRLLLAIAAVAGGFCPAPRVRSTRSPVTGYPPAPRVHGVGPRRRLSASELSELVSPEAIAAFASARGPVAYGAAHSAALREGLSLNSRLRADWYVADFGDCAGNFLLRPTSDVETSAGERAIALVQGWIDSHCPEGL